MGTAAQAALKKEDNKPSDQNTKFLSYFKLAIAKSFTTMSEQQLT